jgi:hypothetical protein
LIHEQDTDDIYQGFSNEKELAAAQALFRFLVDEGELDEDNSLSDLVPREDIFFQMYVFEVEPLGTTYASDTYKFTEDSAKEYVREIYEDEGQSFLDNLPDRIINNNLDKAYVRRYITDMFEEMVWNDPEGYVDESERELSKKQIEEIQVLSFRINLLETEIQKMASMNVENPIQEKRVDELLERYQGLIDDYQEQIQEIEDNPDGDYKEEAIEAAVQSQIENYWDDPIGFLEDWGEGITSNFVDIDGIIDDIFEEDGLSVLSRYDGKVHEVQQNDEVYYIIRID